MKPSDELKMALVDWRDSASGNRWKNLEEMDRDPGVINSVGWIVFEDKKKIILCPHIGTMPDGGEQGCGEMVIPRQCIIRIRYRTNVKAFK